MIKRTCLLVDDEKQDDNFTTIQKEAKKYGIEVECLQFNIGNQERRDLLEDEQVSITKVVSVFKSEFRGKKIDLIAFDWNLGSSIKGPMIIKAFNDNEIRKKVPKILYSAALKDEVEKLFDQYRENRSVTFRRIWTQIEPLISTKALVFVSREDYEIGIVDELRNLEDTVETTLEDQLRKFPELKFKSSFVRSSLRGKSFGEIAGLIENDFKLSNELTKELSEQIIAYLAENI